MERNETYQIREYCPGFLGIGDDSGGQIFLLSLTDGRISMGGSGSLLPDYIYLVADSFPLRFSSGCRFDGEDD